MPIDDLEVEKLARELFDSESGTKQTWNLTEQKPHPGAHPAVPLSEVDKERYRSRARALLGR